MIILDNKQYLSLLINDIEIPVLPSDVGSVIINQHVLAHLPSLRVLNYKDKSGIISDIRSLNDGSKITLLMGRTLQEAEHNAINFRLADPPTQAEGRSSSIYTFYGIHDSSKYLREQANSSYTGSSSSVAKQIAEACGLRSNIDTTNDNMIWLSGRKSNANFMRHLSNHGYINNLSAMINCVITKDGGTLLYKNLSHRVEESSKPLHRFYHSNPIDSQPETTQYRIFKSKAFSSAGHSNGLYGYSNSRMTPTLSGDQQELTTVDAIRTLTNTFELNTDIKNQLGDVRNSYSGPDCGNVHDNYESAVYQNIRLRSLYSSSLKVSVDVHTGVELLDVVECEIYDSATRNSSETKTAKYIVTAKSQEIKGTGYKEVFQLTTTGKNVELDPNNSKELT